MGAIKEDPYIVLQNKIVLLRKKESGIYVYIHDVKKDETTKNRLGWIVTFSELIYGLPVHTIKVLDEHLRGEAYTVNGDFEQFCEADLSLSLATKPRSKPTLRSI